MMQNYKKIDENRVILHLFLWVTVNSSELQSLVKRDFFR